MTKQILPVLCALALAACGDARLQTWRVDPLIKVFPDDTRDSSQSGDAVPLMARNGHATLQFAVRSPSGLPGLKAAVEAGSPLVAEVRHVPLRPPEGEGLDRPLHPARPR